MEYPRMNRQQPPSSPKPPSPRLIRSRSEAENNSNSLNYSTTQRSLVGNRSRSTTRSRKENTNPSSNIAGIISLSSMQKKPSTSQDKDSTKGGFIRFLHRGSSNSPLNNNPAAIKRPKSAASSRSPSAWALSPGRSNVFPTPESPGIGGDRQRGSHSTKGGGGKGSMSSVLRYFKPKKTSQIQEEGYHRFRVLHNRLLQWRFVNARADAAMLSMKKVAEEKLFHVWLRIFNARNILIEKQIEIGKLKHEMKLGQIINPQMKLLNDWAKLEGKNFEAVCRVIRKLSAMSLKLPLAEDARGDVESIHKAINNAVQVMDGIEENINKSLSQVEKILYLLTELSSTLEHQNESLEDMEKLLILVAKLVEWEKSARVNLLQVIKNVAAEEEDLSSRGENMNNTHIHGCC